MGLYNNPFPATYPQMYPQYPQIPQPQIQQQVQQTKMVEVIPVDSVEEAAKYQVQTGASVMFFARDDSFNAVKAVEFNGQESFVVFDKRPDKPVPVFTTREDVEAMIAAALAPKKSVKKEAPEE